MTSPDDGPLPLSITAVLSAAAPLPPLANSIETRLAALLVDAARQNATRGLDPRTVGRDLPCGVIAAALQTTISHLLTALQSFEAQGLVRVSAAGDLELANIGGLLRLASAGDTRGDAGRAAA